MSDNVRINQLGLRRLQYDPAGPVGRAMTKVGEEVQGLARGLAPTDTSALRDSIENTQDVDPRGIVQYVGSRLPYAIYVEMGTGLFSERPGAPRTPITAKKGSVLHFVAKDGKEVFTRSVRGQHPQPFLRNAIKLASVQRKRVSL